LVNIPKYYKPEIIFYCFLAFFCLNNLCAQSYSGALIIQDSLSFPYYIKLDQNGSSGYSVSDIQGSTETFSLIDINQSDNEMEVQIEESQLIYTRLNDTSYDDFCKIIFKTNLNSKSIYEEFKAITSNESNCGNGIVQLENTKSLSAKLKKIKSKIEKNRALKILTRESDRETSVKKIEQLLKLAVLDYSTQISINSQDFFDFIFFNNYTNITLIFENITLENWKNFIQVKNGLIVKNNNSLELVKTSDTSRSTIVFSNENLLAGRSFIIKINKNLSLRFLFPNNFENISFRF
tara:strand:- start:79935 stop:80813 length:879 start_codon:yes stop_codon:yes gene_type:complete